MYKFAVLAAVLAVANAGYLAAPAAVGYAAPAAVGYAAPAAVGYAAPAYATGYAAGYATPAITAQQSNILRTPGNLGQISTYSKSIDTPYSSVRKSDVRVSNDALAYGAVAAPAYGYAAPAYAHAAPVAAAYAAPVAATYAAPAVAARAGLLGVAYSAAPAVTHLSFDGYGVHYGY